MRGGLGALTPDAQIRSKFSDFAARLDGAGPLGVAVSGGGDSVAMLYALAEWGQRPLEVFCVDHGLNSASPQWTQSVAGHAARLKASFTALHWQGEKPATGLSAAARIARHELLAQTARARGVRVLCLAHTQDDIAEARAMRAQGSNVGAPKSWSPSPVWPEGRGIFLYRPFLDLRRETLRDYLRGQDATWIEDPANDSPHSLRAQTRKALRGEDITVDDTAEESLTLAQIADLMPDDSLAKLGLIAVQASAFHDLPRPPALKFLAAAAVCAGGGDRLPRRDRVEALYDALADGLPRTLAGARIRQGEGGIRIGREAGDIGRNGAAFTEVAADNETVWDGRFVVTASQAGRIGPSGLLRGQLDDDQRAALTALPAELRRTLPVFQKDNQNNLLPANAALRLPAYNGLYGDCLVLPRLRAALGLIDRESRI